MKLLPYKPSFVIALLLAILMTGCARIASVSERRPRLFPVAEEGGDPAVRRMQAAMRTEKRQPLAALGEFLAVAHAASAQLVKDPRNATARETYNFAVARAVTAIQKAQLAPWKSPVRVPSAEGDFLLTWKKDLRPGWNPGLYEFVPADQFDVRGSYVRERSVREGVGAPLVAIGRERNEHYRTEFGLPRTFYGVTALLDFRGRNAVLSFEDPLAVESTRIDGKPLPLAADFTVPLAVLLESAKPQTLGLPRLLQPEKYAETARISRLEPYDPKKTVVLVIHGLMDSEATWTPMINKLRADPQIRANYQFWFFSYPSGYPYPYSAALLRRELDAVGRKFAIRKPMVVIGHSMGGCIGRLLVTDSGTKLWTDIFGKSPAATSLDADDRHLIEETLLFKHRPEVGRVIFISAPLRGSDIARNPLGRIGSMLVKVPSNLQAAGDALRLSAFGSDDLRVKRIPNSIDTLAPNNRFVKSINSIPMKNGVPLHVISGDRGKGGNKDRSKPAMSDGVVPYWSSHIDGAVSELVVPSNHGAHQNATAIEEVRRILVRYSQPGGYALSP